MKIYVVVTIFQGVIDEVAAFAREYEARHYKGTQERSLGIDPEVDASEYDSSVTIHEVDVNLAPSSILETLTCESHNHQFGVNCWSPHRFLKGQRCHRVRTCEYPERATCKAVDAEVDYLLDREAREKNRIAEKLKMIKR